MKRVGLSVLLLVCSNSAFSEEKKDARNRCGQAALCASKESSVLSMMGWGVGLFAGFAVLCSLMDNNPESTSTSSNSHSH